MTSSSFPSIEVMAPVGSYESLMAAVQGGANSVYFGIGKLNMRSRSASNFTVKDLPQIAAVCREHGMRSYVTVNTVVYDGEMQEMQSIVQAVKANGLTAVIATDISVIAYARSLGVEVHMSTQTNITNIESVRFWAQFADVMVTARELSLDQVKEITRQIREENITGPSGKPVQIEIFAHGALCMAISGKCYLSLDNFNSSGNRGACLQPCRRPYKVTDRDGEVELEIDNEYIMSPKDLCTIGILDHILDAGVTVLKIEGRGRSADYVKTVVRTYREAVDAIREGTYDEHRVADWTRRLETVYNRGFWTGYYLGQKLGEWSEKYGSQATKRKVYVGKVSNYYQKIGVAEVTIDSHDIKPGDELNIIGPTTGVYEGKVEQVHLGQGPVEKAVKGDVCSFEVTEAVRRGDKVYKVVDATLIKEDYYPKEEKIGLFNYHTHSHYCDGKGSIDDHVTHALASGFHSLGFSSHAPVPFDNDFALKEEDVDNYCREVRNAAKRYQDKIHVYLALEIDHIPGITKDYSTWVDRCGLDYTIGGIHLVKPAKGEGLWFTDGSKQETYDKGLKELFGGDIREAVGAFYGQTIDMLRTQRPDIIAHLDKVRMHNRDRYFRQDESWYVSLVEEVLDTISEVGTIIEVNTRGLYKKRSDDFFPAAWILPMIRERGIPVTVSADAHAPGELDLYFREAYDALKKAGLTEVQVRTPEGWEAFPIRNVRLPR